MATSRITSHISRFRPDGVTISEKEMIKFLAKCIGEPVWDNPKTKTRQVGEVISARYDPKQNVLILDMQIIDDEYVNSISNNALKGISIGGYTEYRGKSVEDLIKKRQEMGEINFEKEYMNNPVMEKTVSKLELAESQLELALNDIADFISGQNISARIRYTYAINASKHIRTAKSLIKAHLEEQK